jgi:sugar/nucleoside kinase (ribokinase family)
MNTFLGVSPELNQGEVDATLVRAAQIVYLEGYLFDRPEAKEAFRQAADIAAKADRRVALSLSDSFCVGRHRAEFLKLIRSHIDILFANEHEVTALYETSSFDEAARRVKADAELAILTRSARGSVILADGSALSIPAEPVMQVVDATGAGDLYAAGFLFGLASGCRLEVAGQLASLAAAEIISHLGARPEQPLAALARDRGLL